MSLNWDATEAANWHELNNYTQESLIFASIPLGFNRLTTENYREMYSRYLKLSILKGWKPTLTLDDFRKGVGLHTNASTKTPAKYGKDLLYELDEHVKVQIRIEEEVGA